MSKRHPGTNRKCRPHTEKDELSSLCTWNWMTGKSVCWKAVMNLFLSLHKNLQKNIRNVDLRKMTLQGPHSPMQFSKKPCILELLGFAQLKGKHLPCWFLLSTCSGLGVQVQKWLTDTLTSNHKPRCAWGREAPRAHSWRRHPLFTPTCTCMALEVNTSSNVAPRHLSGLILEPGPP